MDLQVTIQIDGADTFVGTLFTKAKRGSETATFTYDAEYLARRDAFPLAPDMPLTAGPLHARGMFAVFADAMPDRWGRNLLMRGEARRAAAAGGTPRTLLEADYLAGVSDETRQGALRFWLDGKPVAPLSNGVPRETSIAKLLGESYLLEEDDAADIHDLLSAGSSLGGARPKASIIDESGKLAIAKFPKKDESLLDDTCAWEHVALRLAERAGVVVPASRVFRVDRKAVLLVERFDRNCGKRIPYMRALTAIQGKDGGSFSYLEVVDFLEQFGSRPGVDIPQLWLRILFSCLIGNTDDHMRNHGFLWDGQGWRLSPAFDINPTQGSGMKFLSSAIDLDDCSATVENAMRNADYYRVSGSRAKEALAQAKSALSG